MLVQATSADQQTPATQSRAQSHPYRDQQPSQHGHKSDAVAWRPHANLVKAICAELQYTCRQRATRSTCSHEKPQPIDDKVKLTREHRIEVKLCRSATATASTVATRASRQLAAAICMPDFPPTQQHRQRMQARVDLHLTQTHALQGRRRWWARVEQAMHSIDILVRLGAAQQHSSRCLQAAFQAG